jgi:hypothetical protein
MFVARWQFTTQFGKMDDAINLLRRWEIDVASRVGWKPGSVRVLTGFVGGDDSHVEYEARCDSLTDFEAALRDLERIPHEREYKTQFERVIVSGTSKWTILREVELVPGEG